MHIGVDEAGKGPVLGSMFAAAVRVDPDALPADVGDSKGIQPDRREELAGEIREVADAVAVAEIPAARIDDPETDMNGLTVAAHAEALDAVALADEPDDETASRSTSRSDSDALPAYADAGDADADRFERRVASRVAGVDVRAEHGADATHPVVGAASVVAKVERDAHVARLAEEFGDVGSGYPSDPTTREFLRQYVDANGRLPACARESWQTSRDVLAAADQASLEEF
jgi:ribonuclease HII